MEQDNYFTAVIFRVFKDEHHQVIALFPYDQWKTGQCASYMHVGQHSGASYGGMMETTRPATPEEYADLKDELESIGYKLRIIQRRGVQ